MQLQLLKQGDRVECPAWIMGPSRSTSGREELQLLLPGCDEHAEVGAIGEKSRTPVQGSDEGPDFSDRQCETSDVVQPELPPTAG